MKRIRGALTAAVMGASLVVFAPTAAQAHIGLHGGYATQQKCLDARAKDRREDANNYPVYWTTCFQWSPGVSAGWFFRSYT